MSQQFCLKWNNHMSNMMDVFKNLLSTEAMVDVTLACDGLSLKAHKIVLSACSPFFQSLFLENPCKHPIVILKDMKYTELKAIIEFMYHGEVNVAQDQLSALMKTAETLRVKGLAEVTNEKNQSGDESSHRSVSRTDTPPPKRRRGRTRKRSMSDQSDDGASEPKIKQPDSDIEELSGDMDPSTPYSTASTVPLQSHSTNSFHKSQQEQQPVEQGADESFAAEEKFAVEPSKLLEQTLTTDDLPRRSGRSSVQSNMELQRRPRSSTDHSSSIVPVTSTPMSSDALVVANQQPESPPDIKPELLDLEPPMSPVAGPSHSADENSMMMYMDQSSMSNMPGPSGYQDNSALVSTDSQPQGIMTQQIRLESFENYPNTRGQANICISSVKSVKTAIYSDTIPPLINPKWDQHFEINWEYLPKSIAECFNKGKRLDPRDKREFVRFVTRAITDVCQKPKRKNLVNIIEKIVDRFPKSLADTWCDETAGNGYESLLRKVVHRIDNLNRGSNSVRDCKNFGEKKRKRHPGYKTYGCSNFEPEIIEDEDDLEKKKEVMKDMCANGYKNVNVIVKTLLKQTYKLQRRHINEGYDMNQLIAEWPFLFTIEGLLGHFNELVGIDVRSKLENVLVMKGNRIIAFMSQFTEKCFKKEKLKNALYSLLSSGVLIDELISDMSGLLVLIMEYFEEMKASLFVVVENAIPQNEVESILQMQNVTSPLIVVHGQSEFSYDNCMLYVNGKIVIDEIKTFKDAFICLFCIYYCLNIDYPLSAAATLEFVQRCFFGVNPDYGAKVQKRCKWKMNTKVTKFIEMLSEYEPETAAP